MTTFEVLRCKGKDTEGAISAPSGIDIYKNVWLREDYLYAFFDDGGKPTFAQVDLRAATVQLFRVPDAS